MDYLISDLHLHKNQPHVPGLFFYFMQNIAPNADNLYVLGDLFEYWVGDDFSDELTQSIITAFKNYSLHHGLFFIHGNRDFLLGETFARQTGGTLLTDPSVVILGGVKTILMHGDSLCTLDTEYQQFRQMVRDKNWQQNFLTQPLENRIKLASELRDNSMAEQTTKAEEIMDVTAEEVVNIFKKYQLNRLIHGHTHRQNKHQLIVDDLPLERIVLGDWGETGNYCACDNGDCELVNFAIGEQTQK